MAITLIGFILGNEQIRVFVHRELLGNFQVKRQIFSSHFGQNTGLHDDSDTREAGSKTGHPGTKNPQLGRLIGSPWSGHRIRNIPLAMATSWQGFRNETALLQGWHREPRESAKGFFTPSLLSLVRTHYFFNHYLRASWNYFLFLCLDKDIGSAWLHLPSANPSQDLSDTESLVVVSTFIKPSMFFTPSCPVPQSSCLWERSRCHTF